MSTAMTTVGWAALSCWPNAARLVAMLVVLFLGSIEATPEQIQLQVTQRKDEMMVFWMTNEQTPTSIVRYGTDPNDLDQYSAEWKPGEPQRQYEWNKRGYLSNWMHKIYLRGLEPSTIYFYKCGDEDDGWSAVYWFHTRAEGPGSTVRIAALADQDIKYGSTAVRNSLLQQQARFKYDLLLHAGDMAYADGNQTIWDEWGQWWSAFAAYYPVMYAVGEADIEDQDTVAYTNRLRAGLAEASSTNDWTWQRHWYSFDFGAAHIIFLSSEHAKFENQITEQAVWLERTLEEADKPEKRKQVPWIMVVIHRPLHNNPPTTGVLGPINQRMKEKFEALFRKYRVNIVISGHCRNYERTFPVYNGTITQYLRGWASSPYEMDMYAPTSPEAVEKWGIIYTTVGTAGRPVAKVGYFPTEMERPCIVRHTNGIEEETYLARENDCSNGCWSKAWTSYMNADKGFGVFEVNHTMIYFQYWSAEANRVIDEAIICAVPGCGPPPHATLDELQQPMQPAATRPDMILPPVEALTPPEATETAEARLPDDVGPLDPQYYADYADDGDLHEYPAADEAKGSGGLHQPEPEVTVPAPKVSMEPKPPATFSPKPPATFVTKQPTASPTAAGLVTPEEQGTQPGPVREGSSPSGADGPNLQGSAGTAKQPPEVENLPGLRPQPGKAAWTPKAPAVSNKTGTRPVADSKAGQGSGDKPDHVQGPDSNGFVPIWHVSGEDFVTPYEHSAAAAAAAAAQQAERPAEAAVGPPESASPVGTREAEASLPNVAEVRSTERRVPVGLILAVVALCFATLLGIIASVGLLLLRSRAQAYNASRSDRNALPTTTTHTNAMPMQTDPSLLPSEPGTPASYRPWTQVKRLSSAGASKIRASLEGPVLSLREIHVNALAPTLQASGNGEAEVRPASSSTYLVFGIPTPRWNRSRPSTPGRGQTQPNPLHDPNTSAQQASCDVTQMPTPEMA